MYRNHHSGVTFAPKRVVRRRHRIRSSIYQARWNYRYRNHFSYAICILSIFIGIMTESWWMGFGAYIGLALLPHFSPTVGIFSLVYGAVVTLFVAGPLLLSGLIGAAVVIGFVVFSLCFVPMRSSEQYWRDLERDGGPWAD